MSLERLAAFWGVAAAPALSVLDRLGAWPVLLSAILLTQGVALGFYIGRTSGRT
jgi:uncharacterized membrane protein